MCGIYSSFCRVGNGQQFQEFCMNRLLQNRGPDGYSEILTDPFDNWHGIFAGSILWTQGPNVTLQPLISRNGSLFLWNGDNYPNIDHCDNEKTFVNDTEEVFSNISSNGIQYLTNINGPYAFIYYNSEKKELWFGRDVLGRHSLLWSLTKDSVELTSVGQSQSSSKLTEVPNCGVFKVEFSSASIGVTLYPWSHLSTPKELNIDVTFAIGESLQHTILQKNFGYAWSNQDVNIPDFVEQLVQSSDVNSYLIFEKASVNPIFANITKRLKDLLYKSVKRRIYTKPNFCKNCIKSKNYCEHSKLGVLFSGGLDSAILALIADEFVKENEPIDLYNVSFQRSCNHDFNAVPDRITGRRTLEELKLLCPKRKWNFVEINITQEELQQERNNHISKLIYPLTTILDDSLGCALWFAARGQGILNGNSYTSPARIVLLGMGADEMFGGYTKQRKIFVTSGWKGLGDELCRSLNEIGERNLGRDNRVVADHGRQPRTPYLDEQLVSYIDTLPPWQRCFLLPKIPLGIGDKFILRILAWTLGLKNTATLPKKALQFGSHIANPKEKGHLNSDRLHN